MNSTVVSANEAEADSAKKTAADAKLVRGFLNFMIFSHVNKKSFDYWNAAPVRRGINANIGNKSSIKKQSQA